MDWRHERRRAGSPLIVNTHDLPEVDKTLGQFGAAYQNLTPSMRPRGGRLGIFQLAAKLAPERE